MIPKVCKQCSNLVISSNGIDESYWCRVQCSIGAVLYGMNCEEFNKHEGVNL